MFIRALSDGGVGSDLAVLPHADADRPMLIRGIVFGVALALPFWGAVWMIVRGLM